MHPLAHHAGEQGLAPLLLLLGSGGVPLIMAIGRARLGAKLAWPGWRYAGPPAILPSCSMITPLARPCPPSVISIWMV